MATKPLTSLRIHDYPILPITPPPLSGDIDVYSHEGKLFAVTKDAIREIAYEPTERSRILVHQHKHRFIVGDVVRSNYANNTYAKAQANNADNAEAVGIVEELVDADNFYLLMVGEMVSTIVPNLPVGTVLFLSVATPGLLSSYKPINYGEFSKPMAIITEQKKKMLIVNYRTIEIIEDPGFLGWSGFSGYSGVNGIDIPFDIDGGYANTDYWIFDVDGGKSPCIYGAVESIDGGNII
jgi:hypothetical protein